MKMAKAILDQFSSDITPHLIEFGKSLAKIDADLVLFMARKSLCLYDVLLRTGIPSIERCVVSDRLLDMDLSPFDGKKVALIDDTLILGTTLAKAKSKLQERCNAQVSVHVFCADRTLWCRKLIEPEKVQIELDHRRVMDFCTAAVRSLSVVPRPYLVDFPISSYVRIKSSDINALLSSIGWDAYAVGSNLQRRHDVDVFSFFPAEATRREIRDRWGTIIDCCVDILKVRLFCRRVDDVVWLQMVPLVTLNPLNIDSLESLVTIIIDTIQSSTGVDLGRLLHACRTSQARRRLVEYCLAASLGTYFMETVQRSVASELTWGYDHSEAARHFGPWLRHELAAILDGAFVALAGLQRTLSAGKHGGVFVPAELPESVLALTPKKPEPGTPGGILSFIPNSLPDVDGNLLCRCAEVFLWLHATREIPAREEVLRNCEMAPGGDAGALSAMDRLQTGVPWPVLSEYLCQDLPSNRAESSVRLLSLALDVCNDLGMAVPISVEQDGIAFRAYRHGEDVQFTDGELALAHAMLAGILKGSGRTELPRLVVEKALVILVRVGLARRFLEPFYGTSGADGTVRIGFSLKGAVAVLSREPCERADRDMWLSKYLLRRGVLVSDDKGRYQLGEAVEGNFISPSAPDDAFELGELLGLLIRRPERKVGAGEASPKEPPLDDRTLTLLATCPLPRHAAAAIQVELDIFRRWVEEGGMIGLRRLDWNERESLSSALKNLLSSRGHEALHSAKLKYLGYVTDEISAIVTSCADHLSSMGTVGSLERRWRSYWQSMATLEGTGEREAFDPWMDEAALLVWELGITLCIVEVALAYGLERIDGTTTSLKLSLDKLRTFHSGFMATGLVAPPVATRFLDAVAQRLTLEERKFDHVASLNFALNSLANKMQTVANIVESIGPELQNFGRLANRHDYTYMLWYDIIDSTGTIAGHKGIDVDLYRRRVRQFKDLANRRLHELGIIAKKNAGEIFCTTGGLDSGNDEKHIFFAGRSALLNLRNVISFLYGATVSIHGIRLRVHFIPCSFAGTRAYRLGMSPEVQGERFWEHYSRIAKQAKDVEKTTSFASVFMMIGGKGITDRMVLPEGLSMVNPVESKVITEIELLNLSTDVRFGSLERTRKSA